MMRPPDSNNANRFSGGLRHYHRAGGGDQRSWDDWIEGDGFERKKRRNWWRIAGVFLAVAALGGIIAGLIIELR